MAKGARKNDRDAGTKLVELRHSTAPRRVNYFPTRRPCCPWPRYLTFLLQTSWT